MNKFDDELRMALRRQEPSPDFTTRVMARIAQLPADEKVTNKEIKQENPGEDNRWWRKLSEIFQFSASRPQMKWAMAGAMAMVLIVAAFGLKWYGEHQLESKRQAEIAAQAEGERAKEQVMLAMRIASAKLNLAQKKVQENTQRDGGQP